MSTVYLVLLGGFIVAGGTVAILSPLFGRLALRRRWVDAPDGNRKRHSRPIPNVGGLSMAVGFAAAMLFFLLMEDLLPASSRLVSGFFWAGAAIIFLAGLVDDRLGLRCNYKICVQALAAYLLVHAGFRIDLNWLVSDDPFRHALYSMPLTILWIVALINAINLLDGLDGLAAGVSLIALTGMATAFALMGNAAALPLMVALAGILAGFLLHNFHPASIFMGDSGSMLIGYLLAACTLGGSGKPASPLVLTIGMVALAIPIIDTVVAVVRRINARQPVFSSDHDHIHHRILRTGTHRSAVLVLYAAGVIFGIMALMLPLLDVRYWVLPLTALVIAVQLWLDALGYPRISTLPQRLRRSDFREQVPNVVALHGPANYNAVSQNEVLDDEEQMPARVGSSI